MNYWRIIPNIRVSYSFCDITRAWLVKEKGAYVSFLEKDLANLLHVSSVLLTSSGRSALYHILSYLPQKKVIVPAYTCDVVVEAATLAGKDVIYALVDKATLNVVDIPELDADSILIATHQYGFPCKIKEICAACKQKGAIVIEDCAGALGTEIEGQMAGTFGDYAIFSFNASKLINAPSCGGFLIAQNESDYKALKESIHFKPCSFKFKVKSLCKSIAFCLDKNAYIHYWLSKATRHDATKAYLPSGTYKPNKSVLNEYKNGFYNWQAYVVLKQLKRLPELIKEREKLTAAYQSRLNKVYQAKQFDRQNNCIRYPIYLKRREEARVKFRSLGIEVGAGFEHFVCPKDYQEEIEMAKQIAYLPFSSNFSEKEINYIINILNQEANEQSISS